MFLKKEKKKLIKAFIIYIFKVFSPEPAPKVSVANDPFAIIPYYRVY